MQFRDLQVKYQNYDRQKCFVAHSLGAEWVEDLKSACATILPKFNLEPWYAADHFDPTQPLRDKVVELIANSRYGIYDISTWQDKQGNWQLPRNVFIELGIAIALNRPTLLLRHSSNKNLPLPVCLQGIETVEFTGDFTLKKELEKRLPQWLDVPPDRDWLNRFCIFGDRVCSFREQHPCSQQWGQKTLHCHIADGLDKQHPNYCQSECNEIRGAFEEIFSRYSDLEFSYLDERSVVDGYQFLLCSHCQTVRSTPFAIYRISPTTSAETFVAIGISIALEKLFAYKIPKILLVRQEQDLPSLLKGYEVVEAVGTIDIKQKLKAFLPKVIQIVRETSWQPRALPFLKNDIHTDNSQTLTSNNVHLGMTISKFWTLIATSKKQSSNDNNLQVEILKQNLIQLPINEIVDFQKIFMSIHHHSHRKYLWDAAQIIMKYCSDDGFDYFRAWLIAQGKDIFHNTLKDPNTLAEVMGTSSERYLELES